MNRYIKPTVDMYGNRIYAKSVLEAIKLNQDDNNPDTLAGLIETGITRDIYVELPITGWITDTVNNTYYLDFLIPDIRATDNPLVSVKPVSGNSMVYDDEELLALSYIQDIETKDGSVRITVIGIPTKSLQLVFNNIPNRTLTTIQEETPSDEESSET